MGQWCVLDTILLNRPLVLTLLCYTSYIMCPTWPCKQSEEGYGSRLVHVAVLVHCPNKGREQRGKKKEEKEKVLHVNRSGKRGFWSWLSSKPFTVLSESLLRMLNLWQKFTHTLYRFLFTGLGLERFRKHDLYSNFICNPRRNISEGRYAYRQRKQIAFLCVLCRAGSVF